jgi:tRNA modification GTPase
LGVERARKLAEAADLLVWLGEPEDAPDHSKLIRVHARADLPERGVAPAGSIAVSSVRGLGLPELSSAIVEAARAILPTEGEIALNRRQADCLDDGRDSLVEAARSTDMVIVAESLRQARAAFDRLTGRAGVEDFLDALFGRFCLGK